MSTHCTADVAAINLNNARDRAIRRIHNMLIPAAKAMQAWHRRDLEGDRIIREVELGYPAVGYCLAFESVKPALCSDRIAYRLFTHPQAELMSMKDLTPLVAYSIVEQVKHHVAMIVAEYEARLESRLADLDAQRAAWDAVACEPSEPSEPTGTPDAT